MTTLAPFLPRHFQPIVTSSPQHHYHPHPNSQCRHASPYASTSDQSSSDSPAFQSSSCSPLSPPPHKRHLSLPNPTLAALLPPPPSLARQSSKPAAAPHPSRPLFINTSIAGPTNTSTPSSSPFSSSPLTASSLPSVSTIHLNEYSMSQPSTPTDPDPPSYPQYQIGVDDSCTLTFPHPKSPVISSRRVPEVTPPPSPLPLISTLPPPTSTPTSLSSTLAQSFSSEPSLPELLASISMVLHVQLIKDQSSPLRAQLRMPDFREESSTAGGPVTCPSVRVIYQFLLHVFQRGKFSSELGLLSLVYVHRVMASTGVALTPFNYRPLFMASLSLAQKMWDDTPLLNSDFRLLYPQLVQSSAKTVFLSVFNRLEAQLCEALQFNLVVTSETYQLYLTELQAIWAEYEQGGHHQQPTSSPLPFSSVQPHRSSSPLKDLHPSKLSAHRHHPYLLSERRKSRASEWAEEKDDGGELAGGWDPTVLAIPAGNMAKV